MTTPADPQQRLLRQLQQAYLALEKMEQRLEQAESYRSEPIAVVGAACRFPGGADSPQRFWELLQRGGDVIGEVPRNRWDNETLYDPDPDAPGRVATRYGGFLENIDGFDARFFGVTPREAASLDPQHRLLLEITWEALEDAGCPPDSLVGQKTGVFAGLSTFDYAAMQFARGTFEQIDPYLITGSFPCMAAGRIAYTLGLNGPTLTIDTACSSSLVAVHLACRALRSRECQTALACGVNLMLTPEVTINFSKAHMLSPDGRCKTFDAAANGYVRGEGCAGLVLKRLCDAEADGDRIYAVLRGSAVNHDGISAGITVPNGKAQEAVIRDALTDAGVAPQAVDYIETHGTGTPLGDPLEIEALGAVFSQRNRPLLLGAVKTNLGHTEAAAGLAGLLKAVLCVKHGAVPANLHFHNANPKIPWQSFPVEVVSQTRAWPHTEGPRTAGVSSFGASGTNAHVIVGAYQGTAPAVTRSARPTLLMLSGKDANALKENAARLHQSLSQTPPPALEDVAHTLATGRAHFEHRLALVGESETDLQRGLTAFAASEPYAGLAQNTAAANPRAAFLFTGQGSQSAGMGRHLYEREPVFREALDRCAEILAPLLPQPLLTVMYPGPGDNADLIHQTTYTQPALFALEYALYQLMVDRGIQPAALLGHSVGEITAACIAGVFSLEDGLHLTAHRARLMGHLPPGGSMASIFSDGDTVAEALRPYTGRVDIAAYNGPALTMISGDADAVNAVCDAMTIRDIRSVPLTVSHAFHSPLMEPMLEAFAEEAAKITYHPPKLPLIANAHGGWAGPEVATARYWVDHVRKPVQFQAGMQCLDEKGLRLFVEIGAKPSLCGMGRRCLDPAVPRQWIATLRPNQDDETFHTALGQLYVAGYNPKQDSASGRVISLPGYAFQRKPYWVSLNGAKTVGTTAQHGDFRMLGAAVPLAGSDQLRFQHRVTAAAPTFLADHVIHGSIIMPASAYVETALAAARELFPDERVRMEQLQIGSPLQFTGNAQRTYQVVVKPDDGGAAFAVYSQDEHGEWLRHAEASLGIADKSASGGLDLAQARAQCTKHFEPNELYRFYRDIGLELGPSFTVIREIQLGEGQALGRIEPEPDGEADGYLLHPAVLDACFQVVGPLFLHLMDDHNYLPISVDAVTLDEAARGPLWCYGRLSESLPEQRLPETIRADFTLFNDSGKRLATVHGLRFRKTDRAAILRGLAGSRPKSLLQPTYQTIATPEGTTAPASWLILADKGGLGEQLAQHLTAQNHEVRTVFADTEPASHDRHTLDPNSPDAFKTLLREATPSQNIVYCWACDQDPEDPVSHRNHTTGLLHLTQAAVAAEVKGRTLLVTQGAIRAAASDRLPHPGQAVIWGFGATLQLEHPEHQVALLDLDPDNPDPAADIQRAFAAPTHENRLVQRPQQWFAPRLTAEEPAASQPNPATIREDAAYLISGGFGALGLETAQWLAGHGARELILLGRREPSPTARKTLDRLRDQGVTIQEVQADITLAGDVARVFRDAAEILSPIKGVFHCAGVLDDAVVTQLDREQFERALLPKLAGAWYLHQYGHDLEWFVCYSSVASVLGSIGQAGYSAGNAFLDALAEHRRARGLAALTVNWGPWAGAGMAATAQTRVQEGWRRMGLNLLQREQAFRMLDKLVENDATRAMVVEIAWPRYLEKRYRGQGPGLFEHLQTKDSPTRGKARKLRSRLQETDPDQREEVVTDHVRARIAAIMSLRDAGELEPRQPLFDFGLDSLMAVEVRNQLEADFEVELGATLLFDYPTVEALVRHLIADRLPADLFAGNPAETPAGGVNRPALLGPELDDIPADLDDDAIIPMLLAELKAIEEENHD